MNNKKISNWGTPTQEKQMFVKRGNTPQATRTIRHKHNPIGELPSVEPQQFRNSAVATPKKQRFGLRYEDRRLCRILKHNKRL